MIQPDEVALILRGGQIKDSGTPQALHEPGLLFALPKPIDTVVRIPVTKIFEIEIRGLHYSAKQEEDEPVSFMSRGGLDPEKIGYVISGDGNVLHLQLTVRYEVIDPVSYRFDHEDPQDLLRSIMMSSVTYEVGRRAVDDILSDGRTEMIKDVKTRAQLRIEAVGLGLEVVSVELVDLVPPYAVRDEFEAVQSASIDSETSLQKAREYRASQLPLARSRRSSSISEAKEYAMEILAEARSESKAFLVMVDAYYKEPKVTKERLYRESLEEIFSDIGQLRFVPPPIGQKYPSDFRIQVEMDPR
jgi:modulator of FtsH protease HflK